MKPETRKLINESPFKDSSGYNIVKVLKGSFATDAHWLILKHILFMTINGVDIYDLVDENDLIRVRENGVEKEMKASELVEYLNE